MRRWPLLAVIVGVGLVVGRPAEAQVYLGQEAPRRGSIEVTAGGGWAGGFDVTTEAAELTQAAGNDAFDLFTSDGHVDGFPGGYARLGLYLTRTVSIEGGIRFARPTLSFELAGDAESAADATATETLSHYVFDGSLLLHFPNASFAGGRAVPFVSGGGGYLRELHEGSELVETGDEFHATAGLKVWLTGGAGRRRFGLRGEVGVTSRGGGFEGEDSRRTLPLALGGATFLF